MLVGSSKLFFLSFSKLLRFWRETADSSPLLESEPELLYFVEADEESLEPVSPEFLRYAQACPDLLPLRGGRLKRCSWIRAAIPKKKPSCSPPRSRGLWQVVKHFRSEVSCGCSLSCGTEARMMARGFRESLAKSKSAKTSNSTMSPILWLALMNASDSASWIRPDTPMFRLQKTPHCWKDL